MFRLALFSVALTLLIDVLRGQRTTDSPRWTFTSTQGGNISLGSPITLTWSICPDGLALPSTSTNSNNNPNPQSDLIARLDNLWNVPVADRVQDLTLRPWFLAMKSRLDLYQSKTGITYQCVTDDGAVVATTDDTGADGNGTIDLDLTSTGLHTITISGGADFTVSQYRSPLPE